MTIETLLFTIHRWLGVGSRTVFAGNGELFAGLARVVAIAVATHSGFSGNGDVPSYDAQIEMDQWSITSGLNRLCPLHRVNINDDAGTVVYVSDIRLSLLPSGQSAR